MAIDIEAKKQGLKGLSKENIPQVKAVLKARGLLLLPLIIVIGTLLMGKTPIYAGFLGILTIIVASWLTPDKTVRMTLTKVADALAEAARGSVQVTIACAAIGVIICVVTMTGIGATLAFNIMDDLTGCDVSLYCIKYGLTINCSIYRGCRYSVTYFN